MNVLQQRLAEVEQALWKQGLIREGLTFPNHQRSFSESPIILLELKRQFLVLTVTSFKDEWLMMMLSAASTQPNYIALLTKSRIQTWCIFVDESFQDIYSPEMIKLYGNMPPRMQSENTMFTPQHALLALFRLAEHFANCDPVT